MPYGSRFTLYVTYREDLRYRSNLPLPGWYRALYDIVGATLARRRSSGAVLFIFAAMVLPLSVVDNPVPSAQLDMRPILPHACLRIHSYH